MLLAKHYLFFVCFIYYLFKNILTQTKLFCINYSLLFLEIINYMGSSLYIQYQIMIFNISLNNINYNLIFITVIINFIFKGNLL